MSIFTKVVEIQPILDNICQFFQVILTIFTSNILAFYRFYESLQKLTKVNESLDIPQYFLSQITHFRSVSSNYEVLLAFRDFALWQMRFFFLLSYRFAIRWHQQKFCHRQTKGDFSNIADTYCIEYNNVSFWL